MEIKNLNKSSGAVSKGLLIFGIIVVLTIIISFVLIRFLTRPVVVVLDEEKEEEKTSSLIFEVEVDNIKFNLIDAKNRGKVLYGKDSIYANWQNDLRTTEKFIEVTIGAVNTGTEYIEDYSWDIGEIIDSEGRKFLPAREAELWYPSDNQCGVLLKPQFSPRECTKIYEVAEVSSNLKVRVFKDKRTFGGGSEEGGIFIDLGF